MLLNGNIFISGHNFSFAAVILIFFLSRFKKSRLESHGNYPSIVESHTDWTSMSIVDISIYTKSIYYLSSLINTGYLNHPTQLSEYK